MMSEKMTAPKVDMYIQWLGNIQYREVNTVFTYDPRSYELLDEIFTLLKKIKPNGNNKTISLYFSAERGPIEDYGDYEELKEWNDYESYDEFVKEWRDYYPEEVMWFPFTALEDNGYRAIFLNHKHVIEVDDRKEEKCCPNDISDFCEWILTSIKECMNALEKGTYNEIVRRELPYHHRTGTITRKAYWDIFPAEREYFFENLSSEETEEFCRLVSEQPDELKQRIPEMTANKFFEYCALGYQANNYKGCDLSPREQYCLHADGRDDGLGELPSDSAEAFENWLNNHEMIGHPWEVCRGGNSTHISLYVWKDEKGYYLTLAGDAESRTVETVKFYLALHRAGIPIFIHSGKKLVKRLREEEFIGIVPEGVFPRYCDSLFPDKDVIDFMNLPYERRAEVVQQSIWQEIPVVELVDVNKI